MTAPVDALAGSVQVIDLVNINKRLGHAALLAWSLALAEGGREVVYEEAHSPEDGWRIAGRLSVSDWYEWDDLLGREGFCLNVTSTSGGSFVATGLWWDADGNLTDGEYEVPPFSLEVAD